MRLIDADSMIDELRQEIAELMLGGLKGTPPYTSDLKSMIDRLKDEDLAPTIDAVPVVRCRDCKYFEVKHTVMENYFTCENADCHTDSGFFEVPNGDWFCADGERKGGEEK